MTIEMKDQRTGSAALSTGTPAAPPEEGDTVLVQALTSYLEGQEHKGPHSEPYAVPRFHAAQLEGHGIARILGPVPKPSEPAPPAEEDEDEGEGDDEVEIPDDTSSAPNQNTTALSSIPALPGATPSAAVAPVAQPVTPPPPPAPVAPPVTPPAPAPAARRGRGRPAAKRG